MRDTIKNEQYFDEYIEQQYSRIDNFSKKILDGTVPAERVPIINAKIDSLRYSIMIAKYSRGINLDEIKEDYISLLKDMKIYWTENSGYRDMLVMMSLGILLGIDQIQFKELSNLVDKYNRRDALLDFYISYMESGEIKEINDSLAFQKPYKYLADIVNEPDDRIKAVKLYLEKHLIKDGSDGSNEKLYCGYWGFEAGAIVKILGLNDEDLKDEPFYPYDLVHFN